MRAMLQKTFLGRSVLLLPLLIGLLASCIGDSTSTRGSSGSGGASLGGGSGRGAGGTGGLDNAELETAVVTELRHFVDPYDGGFRKKLSLPRNYTGDLYLAGLNMAVLRDRLVRVRFKFGKDEETITLNATVTSGPEVTGTGTISMLAIHINQTQFQQLRLLYDLYDYTEYGPNDNPTQDNRHPGLYCRGLKLQHDPTFESTTSDCSAKGDKCLFAYAQVRDSGLYARSNGINLPPREVNAQLDYGAGKNYNTDTAEMMLKKCLPDNGVLTYTDSGVLNRQAPGTTGAKTIGVYNQSFSGWTTPLANRDVLTFNGQTYQYISPYVVGDKSNWHIGSAAAVFNHRAEGKSPRGLFMMAGDGSSPELGYFSMLFPRGGVLPNRSAIYQYVGNSQNSSDAQLDADKYITTLTRVLKNTIVGEDTEVMDGCNMRAVSQNSALGIGIGKCNVSATIEVIAKNDDGEDAVIVSSNEVKLQLIRDSTLNAQGDEVLVDSFNNCSADSQCAQGECCYNGRCLSESIAPLCRSNAENRDNLSAGESCSLDYQCASLCCNGGTCRNHSSDDDPEGGGSGQCQKIVSDSCVSNEWCARQSVERCAIIFTPPGNDGLPSCTRDCRRVEALAQCIRGTCAAPAYVPKPAWDPANNNPEFCLENAVENPFLNFD